MCESANLFRASLLKDKQQRNFRNSRNWRILPAGLNTELTGMALGGVMIAI